MATNAERQKAYRERLKASGLVRVTVWCKPETAKALAKMKPEQIDELLSGNGHEPRTVAERVPLSGNAPGLQRVDAHEALPGNGQPGTKVERKAALMKRIAGMLQRGTSYRQVAAKLNEDGEPTLSGRGKWQGGTIKNLVS